MEIKNEAENLAKAEDSPQTVEPAMETGITETQNDIYCLNIIGQIEGHTELPEQNKSTKYEHVIPQLVAIEQEPKIKGLLIILNTVGGDVEAGLALAELIAGMTKPTASIVLGGGHSIGVPLAVSARRSYIVPSATMTIHPVRMNGLVLGVPQILSYFEQMQERISNFVVKNSKIKKPKFKELMMATGQLMNDIGTNISGEQAVEVGLIDEIGNLREALGFLRTEIEKQEGEKGKKQAEKKPGSRKKAMPKTVKKKTVKEKEG